jgi:fumarylacetoacetase
MSAPQRLMQSNFRDSWWTVAQLLAHHTASGCNLQTGDLLGSGTQSGPGRDQGGSLLELTHGGKAPLTLSSARHAPSCRTATR